MEPEFEFGTIFSVTGLHYFGGYQQNNQFVNKDNLKYISVDHFIGGLEFKPATAMQFSLEGFPEKLPELSVLGE